MAYCRFDSDSSIYVYSTGADTLRCEACCLVAERNYDTSSAKQMLKHLLRHRAAGDRVPMYAMLNIADTAATPTGFELWVNDDEAWPAMCVLADGRRAWLMFLSAEGEPGIRTAGDGGEDVDGEEIVVRLDNGQVDRYPIGWTVQLEAALNAAEVFLQQAEPDRRLTWVADQE